MAAQVPFHRLKHAWLAVIFLSSVVTAQESSADIDAVLGYFQRLRSVPGFSTEYVVTQPGSNASRAGEEKFLTQGVAFRRQWIPSASAPVPFSEQGFTLSLTRDAHQILLQHVLQMRSLAGSSPIAGGGQGESFDGMADPILLRPWQWLGGEVANTPRNLAWYDIFDDTFLRREFARCAPLFRRTATDLRCIITGPSPAGLAAATVTITFSRDLPWPELALPVQLEWRDHEGTVQRTAHFRYRAFPCPDGSTLPLMEQADFVAVGKDSSDDLTIRLQNARILAASAVIDLGIPPEQVRRRVSLDTGQPVADPPAQIIRLEP